MSDLRDYTPSNDISAPRFIDEPASFNAPAHEAVFVDDGGLADMHIRSDVEEEGTSRNKLFAGLAVAVLVGIGGAYGVSTFMAGQPVVADNKLPQSSPVTKTAAMTPPPAAPAPEAMTAPTPEAMAPAAPDVVKPATVTKQATMTAAPKMTPMPKSMSSDTSTAAITPAPAPTPMPTQQAPAQAASNVPEPVSPTPPTNSVAGNPALNQQSADPVAPAPVEAAPVEATPQAAAPAPVEAAPAAPAPAAPAEVTPAPAQAQ